MPLKFSLSLALLVLAAFVLATGKPAAAAQYDLVIDETEVNVTGEPVKALTINGSLPAPTLRFKEGEDVTVRVTNSMRQHPCTGTAF